MIWGKRSRTLVFGDSNRGDPICCGITAMRLEQICLRAVPTDLGSCRANLTLAPWLVVQIFWKKSFLAETSSKNQIDD
jgi:hypothetical protein